MSSEKTSSSLHPWSSLVVMETLLPVCSRAMQPFCLYSSAVFRPITSFRVWKYLQLESKAYLFTSAYHLNRVTRNHNTAIWHTENIQNIHHVGLIIKCTVHSLIFFSSIFHSIIPYPSQGGSRAYVYQEHRVWGGSICKYAINNSFLFISLQYSTVKHTKMPNM